MEVLRIENQQLKHKIDKLDNNGKIWVFYRLGIGSGSHGSHGRDLNNIDLKNCK